MIDLRPTEMPILFVCGHRKSGTSLFLNLFDSHRQLLAYPLDLNTLYAYFPAYVEKAGASDADLMRRLVRVVVDDLHETELGAQGFPVEEFGRAFAAAMAGRDLRDLGQVLSGQIQAMQAVLETSEEHRFVVVKETSIELYARRLGSHFPKARFIHLVRDPRDNYSALRAGIERYRTFGDDEKKLIFSAQARIALGMDAARANLAFFGADRYRTLRFEDLVAEPRATMAVVAEWIGIDFEPSLLQPTLAGKPTRGNNYDNVAMFEISAGNVGRWRRRIPPEEAALIEFLLAEQMDGFGYAREFDMKDHLAILDDYYKWLNYTYLFFDRFASP